MTRPKLHLAPHHSKPAVPYALLKQAVRLFRSELAPRSVRRANARKWLSSMQCLGDKHVYKGGSVTWGNQCKGKAK